MNGGLNSKEGKYEAIEAIPVRWWTLLRKWSPPSPLPSLITGRYFGRTRRYLAAV